MTPNDAPSEYAAQIDEYVSVLSRPISEERVTNIPDVGFSRRSLDSEIRDFANECFEKRVEKIVAFCPLLNEGPLGLEDHVRRFLMQAEQAPAEPSRHSAIRFLKWLETNVALSEEDTDRFQCDRGWLRVEARAFDRRPEYLAFQRRRASWIWDDRPASLSRLVYVADPTRVDVELRTSLFMTPESLLPATATMHVLEEKIRVLMLPTELRELIDVIDANPEIPGFRLAAEVTGGNTVDFVSRVRDLLQHGLIAVASTSK